MFERILVPLDGSDVAEGVLPYVEEMAKQFNSEVVLLRAITPLEQLTMQQAAGTMGVPEASPELAEQILEAERDEATEYLRGMKARLTQQGMKITTEIVERRAASAILDYAEAHQISLVAMSTHGRGGLGRLIFGSVTDEVLRQAPNMPMLLVRAQ